MPDSEYAQRVQAWRSGLDADIRRENGPLALSGLFWLQQGINTVGSSPDCSICLPKPIPRLLGVFDLDGAGVTFGPDIGQSVEIDGALAQTAATLRVGEADGGSLVRSGDISMALIRHAAQVGVRVWNAAKARDFAPRSWFELHEAYYIQATYTPYPSPVKLKMPDSLAKSEEGYVQGYVSFRLEGKSHNLDATETEDGRLFLPFRDLTNGFRTYPEGRYLETEAVSEDGKVVVDFNTAYNPPSAFTAFATCTYAPKESALKCAIEAGERFVSASPDRR